VGKIGNVLTMLKILENGQKYTVKELAERLEVSKRMIKIYKSELEKAGIYIETLYGPYGGYVYNHKNNYDIEFNYSDIDNIENILNKLSQKEKNNINITLEKIDIQFYRMPSLTKKM
jgi:predicted DNA-binding transcriptional regulator YafY